MPDHKYFQPCILVQFDLFAYFIDHPIAKLPHISFRYSKQSATQGIEVFPLSELLADKADSEGHSPYAYHRVTFYVILMIQEGQCYHQVDFERYELRPGDSLLICPNQIHAFDPAKGAEGDMVVFTEAFLQRYTSQAVQELFDEAFAAHRGPNFFQGKSFAHMEKLKGMFFKEKGGNKPYKLGAQLTLGLLSLAEAKALHQSKPAEGRTLELFRQFKQSLSDTFSHSRDAAFYAAHLSISYKHLNEVCKLVVNQTAKAYIDHFVILEAKRLLVASGQSVKEIAFAIGFEEPTNFVKFFKKHVSKTPLEFRHLII